MADRREPPRFDALLPPETVGRAEAVGVGKASLEGSVVNLRPRAATRCS